MFQATVHDGLARCGHLVIGKSGSVIVQTPAPMLYTRRGTSVFLTPEMLEKLRPEAQLVQVNTLQFLNQPSPEVLRRYGRGLASYMGLPRGWPLFASNRDPALTEYLSTRPASDGAAYATLHSGAMAVSPARFMEAIGAMAPDMFVALADEVPGDAKPKRVTLSVDRTTKWLDQCILLHAAAQQEQQGQQQQAAAAADGAANGAAQGAAGEAAAAPAGGGQLFAPVVGGASEAERARSAKAAAERDVAGFALCGFGMGELPSARPGLLRAALQELPASKPRAVVGLDSPDDVLIGVTQGVDLFDCSYPLHATANGYALAFPLSPEQEQQQQQDHQQHLQQQDRQQQALGAGAALGAPPEGLLAGAAADADADAGCDDTKLNLWSLAYRLDRRPLVPGCGCFACAHHSRAYIHHLLHTHEMLAGVLLEAHNTHWWLAFFEAVRGAVRGGRLRQYADWFGARRQRLQQQQQQQQQQPQHQREETAAA